MTDKQKRTSVLVDGVFDCTHFAHANCLRRAQQIGEEVVAGIHPDSEVFINKKCYPVFTEDERYELVTNLRYCDRSIQGIRYEYTLVDLDLYGIDFNAHGDEPVISGSGKILGLDIKEAGRYKVFPRTDGTCTTDVIAQILAQGTGSKKVTVDELPYMLTDATYTQFLDLLMVHNEVWNNRMKSEDLGSQIQNQDVTLNGAAADKKIIYTEGLFNLFNIGHLKFLQKAKALGDFLIVGIISDRGVLKQTGNPPLLSAIQRALNVLSYRLVDAVILRADDGQIDDKFITNFGISLVCHGQASTMTCDANGTDPFYYVKQQGIFQTVDSESKVTSRDIIQRVLVKRDEFEARNKRKLGQAKNG